MPAPVPSTTDPDEWQKTALAIARVVQRGPGSPHERVRSVRAQLVSIAEENYKAGEIAGKESAQASLTSWMGVASTLQNAVLPLIPEDERAGSANDIAAALTAEVKRLHREIVTRDETIHAQEQKLAQQRGTAASQQHATTRIGTGPQQPARDGE